jgi:hypothetical protein
MIGRTSRLTCPYCFEVHLMSNVFEELGYRLLGHGDV